MKYIEFTGKTVEEAVETGLNQLGLTKDQADIRVLEEGKKKLFGSVKARVEIAALEETACEEKSEETCEECAPIAKANGENATDGERTVEFLEGLFKLLKITACTELVSEDEKVVINVTAANSTSVIGKHGATLDAIQTLAGAVANTGRDDYKRVVVDCENYRENREATLQKLAANLAAKAQRMGRKIKLEPMNPYERRIIHSALSEIDGVKTESEGKEPNRYIVVIPDNLEDETLPAIPARSERRGNDRNERRSGGRGGKGGFGGRSKSGFAGKSGGFKKFNRDNDSSSNSGGTTMKASTDFFGIFLGNSGNSGEDDK
ncbi:MAG: protein jag [Clostridia bacterium]|nr:protein jag [Clostridia bacterium]